MSAFITLAPDFLVSPQIDAADVMTARAEGVRLIINNRPDDEEPGPPTGAAIEAAAREAGIAYVAIPVGREGVTEAHLDAFDATLAAHEGLVLAYCRSGTRSTLVRAFARARGGEPAATIIAEAAVAGYDISGQRPVLESLARR